MLQVLNVVVVLLAILGLLWYLGEKLSTWIRLNELKRAMAYARPIVASSCSEPDYYLVLVGVVLGLMLANLILAIFGGSE